MLVTKSISLHCKKVSFFPFPEGMSLTKLSPAGKNLITQRVWQVTSRLGTGKWLTLISPD
jgi:hypothetical protein